MAKKDADLILVSEAAKRLGVEPKTVRSWVASGRLGGTIEKLTVVKPSFQIHASSLADAFKVTCPYCGEVFTSARPEKAEFCCQQHYDFFHDARIRTEKARVAAEERAGGTTP